MKGNSVRVLHLDASAGRIYGKQRRPLYCTIENNTGIDKRDQFRGNTVDLRLLQSTVYNGGAPKNCR
uniref:Uncharacterized protein n=1 Tax=Anguilla anguilla TaxID=7936 RepID=A0A0E9VL18_ANGAN